MPGLFDLVVSGALGLLNNQELDPTREEALAGRASRGLLGWQVPRDPGYVYGSILPYRMPVGGGQAEWNPLYSGLEKGVMDAFTAPNRARTGNVTLVDAMNLAMNVQLSSAGGLLGSGGLSGKQQHGILGATVYHGSPHRFDKFDASKIGAGEGAQAYGHGLYFAENPGVAKTYMGPTEGVPPSAMLNGKRFDAKTLAEFTAANRVVAAGSVDKAIQRTQKDLSDLIGKGYATDIATGEIQDAANVLTALNKMKEMGVTVGFPPMGNLYTVDLPDEQIAKMLDWDKPLTQQPHVMSALRETFSDAEIALYQLGLDPYKTTGKDLYYRLSGMRDRLGGIEMGGREAQASSRFKDMGIPGIKYLDAGSRSSGKGTHNYVVFPGGEDMLKILSRE